jgi:hypothetical protein
MRVPSEWNELDTIIRSKWDEEPDESEMKWDENETRVRWECKTPKPSSGPPSCFSAVHALAFTVSWAGRRKSITITGASAKAVQGGRGHELERSTAIWHFWNKLLMCVLVVHITTHANKLETAIWRYRKIALEISLNRWKIVMRFICWTSRTQIGQNTEKHKPFKSGSISIGFGRDRMQT